MTGKKALHTPLFRNPQSGSVIFYILIAIVLLAAVSIAVSQNLRLSGSQSANMTTEKMDLQMTELTQFLEAVRMRVHTLLEVNGVHEMTLSFKNSTYLRANSAVECLNDNNSCTIADCKVYSPENPEGVVPVIFDQIAEATPQSVAAEPRNGTITVRQLAIEGIGTSAQDLILLVNGVSGEFCNHFNKRLGLTTTFTEASEITDIGETDSTSVSSAWGGCGSDAAYDGTNVFGEEATQFKGLKSFCAPLRLAPANGRLSIVYVLIAH